MSIILEGIDLLQLYVPSGIGGAYSTGQFLLRRFRPVVARPIPTRTLISLKAMAKQYNV